MKRSNVEMEASPTKIRRVKDEIEEGKLMVVEEDISKQPAAAAAAAANVDLNPKKLLKLKTCDNQIVQVEETFMLQSKVLMDMIELGCADDNIPLQDVTADILAMVIEYCKKHVVDANNKKEFDVDESLKKWDADFVDVDLKTLYDLIFVAKFLDIGTLLDLTAQKFADIIKYKSISEIRKIFHIQNDLTPAEEEEIRTTNPWAFGN